MPEERVLARLHYELVRGLVEQCACPTNSELTREMRIEIDEVETLLRGLAGIHGVVLHPHVCEPWIVHPFSITPTIHWVEGQRGGWWAPCLWCALGVAAIVGGEVRIHTRMGAEAEALTISVIDGEPIGLDGLCVHFAIP